MIKAMNRNFLANNINDIMAADVAVTDAESMAFRFGVTSEEVCDFLDDAVEAIAIDMMTASCEFIINNPLHMTIVAERMVNAGASPILHKPGWVTMQIERDPVHGYNLNFISDHDEDVMEVPDRILDGAVERFAERSAEIGQIVDDLRMAFRIGADMMGAISGADVTVTFRHYRPVLELRHLDDFHTFNSFLNEFADTIPAGFDVVLYRAYETDYRI